MAARSGSRDLVFNATKPSRGINGKGPTMNGRELDKRALKRTKMVAGLRLANSQSNSSDVLVHTLDISSSGAKVGALREWIEPGALLFMRRGNSRAQCCVKWTRQLAPGEVQIVVELVGTDTRFWGVDLDDGCAEVWLSSTER